MAPSFDIKSFLTSRNVPYWTSGKNVTQGWTQIQCLFCSDPSDHLGISSEGFYNCWRCGAKGHVSKLIMAIEDCSYRQAEQIVHNFSTLTEEVERQPTEPFSLPESGKWKKMHREYLQHRGFDPEIVIEKYGLFPVNETGEYKFSIIIPVIQEGRVVNFSSRDVSGKRKEKYRHCPNNKSIIPINETLYGIDSVGEKCIVVEGTHDVWKIGDGAVALHGTAFTGKQLDLLIHRSGLREVYVMFDGDETGKEKGRIFAEALDYSGTFEKVELILLDSGDPCDLSLEEVGDLRKDIFGG